MPSIFDTEGFPARKDCGVGWEEYPLLLEFHVVTNLLIFLGYFFCAVRIALWRLRQEREEERKKLAWWFVGAFFIFCGGTHAIAALMFAVPVYPFEGYVWNPLQVGSIAAALVLLVREMKNWVDPVQASREVVKMQAIADASVKPFYTLRPDSTCDLINSSAAGILGFTPEELMGKDMHEVIHYKRADGTLYPKKECGIMVTVRTGKIQECDEDVFWTKDDKPVRVRWASSPVFMEGELIGVRVEFEELGDPSVVSLRRAAQKV